MILRLKPNIGTVRSLSEVIQRLEIIGGYFPPVFNHALKPVCLVFWYLRSSFL